MTSDIDDDENTLGDVELLAGMFPDVIELPPEPNTAPVPVVQIQYTAAFRQVMGLYRHLGSVTLEVASPRWLLLLAFVLRKCPAHYSAWKHRRDVVLNPHCMTSCAQELYLVPSTGRSWASEDLPDIERRTVARWCPPLAATRSRWQAVRWELQATKFFALTNPKNFQVWHHRQELVTAAVQHTADQKHQETDEPIPYSELAEELRLCTHVHLNDDSKNYHVWSHRAWFIALFSPIALRWPVSQASAVSPLGTAVALGDGLPMSAQLLGQSEDILRTESCEVHLHRLLELRDVADAVRVFTIGDRTIRVDSTDECQGLLSELRTTADFIAADHFNNSAWSHRFMLLRDHLLSPLVSSAKLDVAVHVVVGELRFALLWARVCPCNESPLVYASSISELLAQSLRREAGKLGADDPWALHRELEKQIVAVVQPRIDDVVQSFASCDGSDAAPPLEYLKRNTFQVTAARYQILRRLAAAGWEELSMEQRLFVNATFPRSRFLPVNPQTIPAGQPQELMELLRCENEAVTCLKHLVAVDTIRSKYWKAELADILDRSY